MMHVHRSCTGVPRFRNRGLESTQECVYCYTMTVPRNFVILSFASNPDSPHVSEAARMIVENIALERWLAEERATLLALLSAAADDQGPEPHHLERAHRPLVAPPHGLTPRLGFVVDIVGFGRRDAERQEDLQHRLDALVGGLVADLGLDRADTEREVAGDSAVVFLPVGMASSYVLPRLVAGAAERLHRDNRRYRDRMRLRMAVGSGLLGNGPLGFTGQLVVDLHRLVDSDLLRDRIDTHEDADLALLITHTLHDEVVRPGYLTGDDLTPVEIVAKEFAATAWLRLC
jgi:hypothetical protein